MYFNHNEEPIIAKFYNNLETIQEKPLQLLWESGTATAVYDTVFEDIDDNTDEEYISFSFHIIDMSGNIPSEVTKDGYCVINYHNFPQKISCNGVLVS